MQVVDWGWLTGIELTADKQARVAELRQTLGHGEAACIALAQSRERMVLTDDRVVRRVAGDVSVPLPIRLVH